MPTLTLMKTKSTWLGFQLRARHIDENLSNMNLPKYFKSNYYAINYILLLMEQEAKIGYGEIDYVFKQGCINTQGAITTAHIS